MTERLNESGAAPQPSAPGPEPGPEPGPARGAPARAALDGTWARLEPLNPAEHGPGLFEVAADDAAIWTYLPYGPFPDRAAMTAWLEARAAETDPLFFAVIDTESGRPAGMVSYLNIVPEHGRIEIGHIWFSALLRRRRAATEAIFLLLHEAFDGLGYRRVEWKCNAENAASRRAAQRFGFTYEGIFRQHLIVKGRNRDSAWFSLLDGEWPARRAAFQAWLDPANFDAEGHQQQALSALIGSGG